MTIIYTPELDLYETSPAVKAAVFRQLKGSISTDLSIPSNLSLSHDEAVLREAHTWYENVVSNEGNPSAEVVLAQYFARGVVFAYNLETGSLLPYTANPSTVDALGAKPLKNPHARNMESPARIEAYRLDSVVKSEDGIRGTYDLKLVGQRAPNILTADKYAFIPAEAISWITGHIFKLLGSDTPVLEVVQGSKIRYVTADKGILERYADDAAFVHAIQPVFNILKAELHIPVIGAASSTAGLTSISVQDITSIQGLANVPASVRKSEGYFESLEFRSSVYAATEYYYDKKQDPTKLIAALRLQSDPEDRKAITEEMLQMDELRRQNLMSFVQNTIGGNAKVIRKFSTATTVPIPASNEEMQELLNSNMLKLVYRRKSGSFGSALVTNSKQILSLVYGPDYEGVLESENYRLRRFLDEVEAGKSWTEEARKFNLGPAIAAARGNERAELKKDFHEKVKKVSRTGVFTARRVSFVINVDQVKEFHLSLSVDQVLSVTALSRK